MWNMTYGEIYQALAFNQAYQKKKKASNFHFRDIAIILASSMFRNLEIYYIVILKLTDGSQQILRLSS